MRIATFSLAYPPFVGGAEIAVKEITDRLLEHDFFCFSKSFNLALPRKEKLGNVEVLRLIGNKFIYIFKAWRAAERLYKERPFDAIWAIMAAYAGFAALLFKLRHPSVPFLLTLQEGDSESHILKRVSIFYPIWRFIFKKADYVQAISNYLADFGRRHGARCSVEVVPNGADLNLFDVRVDRNNRNVKNEQFDQAKRSIKRSDRSPVIITNSRLVYKNGVDTLIEAAAELKSLILDSKFLIQILGEGPDESKLKKLAKELDIEDQIEFLGHISPEKIPDYLAQADIFVRPSRSEGLGSSFLEAMAAGLPVIGTKVGGIPDFLVDFNLTSSQDVNIDDYKTANGLFAKVDDPEDLAGKIIFLLRNDNLRKRLGENGRKLVEEKYSWRIIAEKMNVIFNKLCSPKILIAAGIYPPDIGGPATHVKKLKELLSAQGMDISVIAYGKHREDVSSVSRSWPFGLRHLIYFLKLLSLSRDRKIIYAQDATAAGLPAFLAAKILRKKFIIRIGGDILWERVVESGKRFMGLKEYYQNGLHLRDYPAIFSLVRWVLRGADSLVVPAVMLKDLYEKYYGVIPENIRVILNPLIKKESGVIPTDEDGEPTFLFAGRFVAYKNLSAVIEVFSKVRKKFNKGKLLLIGDGPDKSKLKVKSEKLKGIEILPPMDQKNLFNKIQSASVCLGPALTEFNPNFILECLSFGKPIILSTENGLSAQLPNDFLFDPKNQEDLEQKMVKFFEAGFYQQAKEKIKKIQFSQTWEKVTAAHLELLKSVTSSVRSLACACTPEGATGRVISNGMKVLMISTDAQIFKEGSAVRERIKEYGSLVEELRVVVYCKRNANAAKAYANYTKIGNNVYIYPTKSKLKLFAARDAYRIAKAVIYRSCYSDKSLHDSDYIITTQDPFETGLVGYWLKKKFGIPLQLQVHTDFLSPYFWQESWKNKIRVLLAKRLIKKADGIRVVSQRIKNVLIMSYPLLSRVIAVLPIFVDIERIKNTPIKTNLHKKYPAYDFIILMASRLTKEKNIGLAIEAMQEIQKGSSGDPLYKSRNSEIKNPLLLVVGGGPEKDRLKVKSEKLKVSVIFEPWTDDLASYYKTADLFLLTSNYEGYGRTVVEAMAAGLPVIMTDVGLAEEIIKDGKNGLVFSVGNKKSLIEILSRIFDGRIDIKKMGVEARKSADNFPDKNFYLGKLRDSWGSLPR